MVVGSSGLSVDDYRAIDQLAAEKRLGVLACGNFSITAVLIMKFSELAAACDQKGVNAVRAAPRCRHGDGPGFGQGVAQSHGLGSPTGAFVHGSSRCARCDGQGRGRCPCQRLATTHQMLPKGSLIRPPRCPKALSASDVTTSPPAAIARENVSSATATNTRSKLGRTDQSARRSKASTTVSPTRICMTDQAILGRHPPKLLTGESLDDEFKEGRRVVGDDPRRNCCVALWRDVGLLDHRGVLSPRLLLPRDARQNGRDSVPCSAGTLGAP